MKRLPFWRRPYFAGRILEIGGGHNPFKGITHAVDIDTSQGHQRGGKALVVPGSAKLIVGDAMALPFRSGSFDYVYASHVLEHVESPESACREIMRVAPAGYIETPSPFLEQGLALRDEEPSEESLHKWFVFSIDGDSLVFEPKTSETVPQFCSCRDGQFMREFYMTVDFWKAQHWFRRKAKTTIFYWRSLFRVEVRDETGDCQRDGKTCRFRGMKKALVASCDDFWRAWRLLRFRLAFPDCKNVFRRYGVKTLFIR